VEVDGEKQSDAALILTILAGKPYRLKIGQRKYATVERRVSPV
jgi:hypothetical protein